LSSADNFFKTLVDGMTHGVFLLRSDKTVTYWGYRSDEVIGKQQCCDVLKPVDAEGNAICDSNCPFDAAIRDGKPREADFYIHDKDGRRVPVAAMLSTVRGDDANGPRIIAVMRDHSRMAAAQQRIEELETLSLIDPLTKLGNRLYLEMNLLAKLHELRRYSWPFGVIFCDIDEFKKINDQYGHDAGDSVLVTVSKALQMQSRPFDIVGRWGGDEFCAVIVHASPEQLGAIANRYRSVVSEAQTQHGSVVVGATVSVGAALARPDDTVDTLYRRVDQLMYKSKAAGRNRVTTELDG